MDILINFNFIDRSEQPSFRIPFSDNNVKDVRWHKFIKARKVSFCDNLLEVDFFIIKEIKALHDLIIMNDFS